MQQQQHHNNTFDDEGKHKKWTLLNKEHSMFTKQQGAIQGPSFDVSHFESIDLIIKFLFYQVFTASKKVF